MASPQLAERNIGKIAPSPTRAALNSRRRLPYLTGPLPPALLGRRRRKQPPLRRAPLRSVAASLSVSGPLAPNLISFFDLKDARQNIVGRFSPLGPRGMVVNLLLVDPH